MTPLHAGETCLLLDQQGRKFLLLLDEHKEFSTHRGTIPHASIIGLDEGGRVATPGGAEYVVLRPRREDYVLKMKRGPQVVYPKDVGPILVHGDIRPGHRVLEAGTGSGALTLALIDAVGPTGEVISLDRRQDHADFARRSIVRWFGDVPTNLHLRVGEVEEAVGEVAPDRVVLDSPEPWHTIVRGADTLPGGAVVIAYVPSVGQVEQTHSAFEEHRYVDIEAREILSRDWHVEGRSVRPSHRMVGHTGFLINARATGPR